MTVKGSLGLLPREKEVRGFSEGSPQDQTTLMTFKLVMTFKLGSTDPWGTQDLFRESVRSTLFS